MDNDYLFKAVMQRDNRTLKNLLAALLHMDVNRIRKAEITNPIVLGEHVEDKYFVLDIKVLMDDAVVNLELQVINEANWPERSLCYLCRIFDQLNRGEEYIRVKPAIQIGITNFTVFQDAPEFYATYHLTHTSHTKKWVKRSKNVGLAT